MKKALMITAIVAIVLIAGAMIYYFVFFKPGIERDAIRLQEQKFELEKSNIDVKTKEEVKRKQDLEECLKNSDEFLNEAMSKTKGKTDEQVMLLWKMYQDMREDCYKKYGD